MVAANYLKWRDRLAGLGLTLTALDRDARGAWTLHLGQGLDLELGATRVEERLERFMRTWPQLAAAGRPAVVDLRYANGLAVRWAQGFAPGDAEVAAGRDGRAAPAGADPQQVTESGLKQHVASQ